MFPESSAYFSVPHPFDAYISLWPAELPLPDEAQLQAMKSKGMQLMGEVKALEGDCLIHLRQMGDDGRAIVEYLKLQSRKIDLVLQHLLEQEARDGEHCIGLQFGGSGVRLQSQITLPRGSLVKLLLFVREEILSVLCMAKVTDSREDPDSPGSYLLDMEYSVITEAEVEQLVKASLVIQQKQLKLRKVSR
ncbi:hypothetical protein KDN34_06350 [Shewanella yunxiaonensis]|uniref:PilZ domain-containing protein n=1 Tax=Shewanella yunxiaonensis TaxID=2829809 RepID=A0ABX7YW60_9GAMM|nr:hypothetical protein [Shewanella yunxiaonensis]QUN07052.1 hypothetical protein KDN34_06350 [Shewanella yunxiaonensis]